MRIEVAGVNISNLRCADDMIMIADDEQELQEWIDVVVEESKKMELEINKKRSFMMLIARNLAETTCNIMVKTETLEQVDRLQYQHSRLFSRVR